MTHRTMLLVALGLAGTLGAASAAHAGAKWDPIDPADLATSKPVVDPEAGAEVLLWRITVEDAVKGPIVSSDVSHFLRIKVFDERGIEAAGRPEIEHDKGTVILDFAARTVRPDGSVVEVDKSQRFERTSVKADGVRRKVLSFAFPAAAPGVILEYRWVERRYDDDIDVVTLMLQRALPVRLRELLIKPLPLGQTDWNFKMRCFGMSPPVFEDAKDGYQRALLPPILGIRAEPYMPPELQMVPWATLYYTRGEDPKPEELWKRFAEARHRWLSRRLKVDDEIQGAAREVTVGAANEDQRLDRLASWCRESIENWNEDWLALPRRDLEKMPKNNAPFETLRRKGGTGNDLVYLFVAMCRSLDMDARVAYTASRNEIFFDQRWGVPGPLSNPIAVVRQGDRWRYFDPGIRWIHGEGLAWWEDGQEAFVLDGDRGEFVRLPMAPPDSARTVRICGARLSEDGTLEADVRLEFYGMAAAREREWLDDLTEEERLKRLREDHLPSLPEMVTSDAAVEHLEDPSRPLAERCTVRIPNYASRVGSRLLVPVAFFQQGRGAVFPSDERRHPVYFKYGWLNEDSVAWSLPDGFEVEAAPGIEPLVAEGVGAHRSSCLVSMDGRSARFLRSFRFGDGDAVYFPMSTYPALKRFFDGVAERALTTLSLRRSDSGTGQDPGAGPPAR